MTVEKRKKHINEITEEFKTFWEPLFSEMGIDNPLFYAKLCYSGSEFIGTDGVTSPVFRVYAEQISKNQDIYIELYDWDDLPYNNGYRTLYKFENNSNWRDEESYVEITKKTDGTLLPYPSYAFRLSSLKLVNSTPIKSLFPLSEPVEEVSSSESFNEQFDIDEPFIEEKEDSHYSNMTIRDIYCIVHNTPKSNKGWLNKLINSK
jgi:hypothetical protein